MIEMNLDGSAAWQSDRDNSVEKRDAILRILKENGGGMGIKELVKAAGRNQLSIVMCCNKWKRYFEIERKGWREQITRVQLHRHLMD